MHRHTHKEHMHGITQTAQTLCRHLHPVYTFSYYCLSVPQSPESYLSLNHLFFSFFFFLASRDCVHIMFHRHQLNAGTLQCVHTTTYIHSREKTLFFRKKTAIFPHQVCLYLFMSCLCPSAVSGTREAKISATKE